MIRAALRLAAQAVTVAALVLRCSMVAALLEYALLGGVR